MSSNRRCGNCVVCCVYPRIAELDKPGMTHCSHLKLPRRVPKPDGPMITVFYTGKSKRNCRVFDTDERPACCDAYQCIWRRGAGAEQDRPDRSLMLFDESQVVEGALIAKPLEDGQESTKQGREVIDRMSRSTGRPVLVFNFYERRPVRIVGRGID